MEDQKVAVLLEDIAQKFNILAEGQELLRQDIQNIKTVTGLMHEDIEGVIKPTLKQQSRELKQHGRELKQHTQVLTDIKNQLNILTDEFIAINPDSKPRLKKSNNIFGNCHFPEMVMPSNLIQGRHVKPSLLRSLVI